MSKFLDPRGTTSKGRLSKMSSAKSIGDSNNSSSEMEFENVGVNGTSVGLARLSSS